MSCAKLHALIIWQSLKERKDGRGYPMARTIVQFQDANSELFETCDEWVKTHKFKTVESSASNRQYRRRQPIMTPLSILLPAYFTVRIDRSSGMVTIECWIAFFKTETEVSSESIYRFLAKDILRAQFDDLLTRLNQSDKLIH
jgi:hypothetical protein